MPPPPFSRYRFARIGFVVERPTPDELTAAERDLTISPHIIGDYGAKPKPFPIYARTASTGALVLPRMYGLRAFLDPDADIPPDVPVLYPPGEDLPDHVRLCDGFALNPRKHQDRAVEAVARALHLGSDRRIGGGILSLAVGLGKTVVAIYTAVALVRKRTLIVVHTANLMTQWRERFEAFVPGARVGTIQGSRMDVDGCDFVVAMLQSLAMHDGYPRDLFDQFGFVIYDEVHLVPTHTFSRALRRAMCRRVLGLSATPVRKDGLSCVLAHHIGDVVFAADREATSALTVRLLDSEVGDRLQERRARYGRKGVDHVAMITDLVSDADRNDRIARECAALARRRVLVLSERRGHLEALRDLLASGRYAGVAPDDVGLYIGGMPEAALADSARRDIILGTYSIASVGLDIPGLNVLVLATPRSDIIQASGRILRDDHPDKIIVDVVDRYSGAFIAQMRKRLRFYRQMGYAIESGFAGDDPRCRVQRLNAEAIPDEPLESVVMIDDD